MLDFRGSPGRLFSFNGLKYVLWDGGFVVKKRFEV